MAIRKNLIMLRASNGLSKTAMADRIGVDRSTYSEIESARRDPSAAFITKVQEAFGLHDSQVWALFRVYEGGERR